MRSAPTFLIAALVLLLAGGCGAPPLKSPKEQISPDPAVWPKPPAEPRVSYVRSIASPQDIGIERPFFRRMIDMLVGRSEEHFVRPTGVAERDGVLYVADPGAQALWILDSAQNRFVKVDQAGGSLLVSPVAVAVRPDGAVFLADSVLGRVFLLDREGRFIRVAAEKSVTRPVGLAYDAASERLYIADSANHRIAVYGADGAFIQSWGQGGTGDGQLNRPAYLALDRTGTLLVTDALNFRVQAFDREGRFLWKFGRHGDGSGDFAAPKGVAADSKGHIYVVDALFDAVQIFDRSGRLLLAVGERGTLPGQFWLPAGVFVNPQDEIYVADAYNQRVQVLRLLGGLLGIGEEVRE